MVKVQRAVVITIVTMLALAAAGLAQAADTGTLIVRTTDKTGGAFPGIVVEIKNSKNINVPGPKQSDASGQASFILPAGAGYSIRVSGGGMGEQNSEEFKVEINKSRTVVFTMSPGIVEKVIVTKKIVDLDESGKGATNFSDTFIEDLPIAGRSYQNVLTLAPGVQDSNGDGNPNVHGARDTDFKATVDGVSNVDPLTGTFMSNINPDAIEDIEIVTTGASAEYGGATGGFGKIITKQGSNTFSGTFSLFFRHSIFDGSTINTGTDAEKATYHVVAPSLVFSGPVIKDKLFFVLTHEYLDRGDPINLVGANSIVVVTKGSRNLDKLTYQLSARNKLVFQASADPLRIGPFGIDALTDPRSGVDYKQGGPTYQLHWDAQASSVLGIQSLIGFSHTGIALVPVTHGVKNFCGQDELGDAGNRLDPFGNPGGEPIDEDSCFETRTSRTSGSYPQDYSDDRIRYTVKSDANYFLDNFMGVSHTFKAGIQAEKNKFRANDSERSFSIFTESLASFHGTDDAPEPGGGALFRTVSIPGQPQVASQLARGSEYAAYIEDQFRPHSNVSVRVGVRVQQENLKADGYKHFEPRDEAHQFQLGFDACSPPGDPSRCARQNFHFFHTYELFPVAGASPIRAVIEDPSVGVQKRTPETFRISNTNVAPRLSLSWDPGTNGKTKVFGTAGRYYGDTFLRIPLYEQPPDTFGFQYTVIPDLRCSNDPNGTGTKCIHVPTIDSDQNSTVFPANIHQVDRNLKTPYQDEYTLGFTREVFQETSITVTAIKRSFKNQFQDIDVNHYARDLGNSTTQGCAPAGAGGPLVPVDRRKDGVFDDCGGRTVTLPPLPPFFTPRFGEIPDGIADLYIFNPFFNQIQRVGNFNKTNYKAFEVELNRRLHRNWQLEASYVWSKATGNAEDFNSALGSDPTTVQDEFGYLGFDQRHVVKVNVSTQLPLWNVRLSSAFVWQTGLPYSITEERQSNDQPRFYGPFRIAYSQARTTFPTHQRNDQRNSAFWNFDIAGRKDFTIGKTNLETSVDVFNVFNDDSLRVDAVQDDRVVAERHLGRRFQLGAKLTF